MKSYYYYYYYYYYHHHSRQVLDHGYPLDILIGYCPNKTPANIIGELRAHVLHLT